MVQRRNRRKLTAPDLQARPRRSCRIPAALTDMIVDAPKGKKLEHVKASKKRNDTSRSDEDSGYEEIDRNSFSLSPNSSVDEDRLMLDTIMDHSHESQIVRPVSVSEADESDSNSCDAGLHNDTIYRCQSRKKNNSSQSIREPLQDVELINQMQSGKRMLMKDWILYHLEKRSFPGLRWFDEKKGLCQISWKHRSAGAWCRDDVKLFECWANYTGRHESDRDFKRWKANFRCALNILPDMEEITQLRNPKGKNPYKVYRFLDKETRTSKGTKSCSSVYKNRKRRQTMTPECSIEEACSAEAQLAVERIQPHSNTVQSTGFDYQSHATHANSVNTGIDPVVSQMYGSFNGSTLLMISEAEDSLMPAWSPPSEATGPPLSLASATTEKFDAGFITSSRLPSVDTLVRRSDSNCITDSLQDLTACDMFLGDTLPLNEYELNDSLLSREPMYLQDCDLLSPSTCILSDDSEDILEWQTLHSIMEESTQLSTLSIIPLTVEELSSE